MTYELLSFQQQLVNENPKKTGVFWGTGCGKTLATLIVAEGPILVIAPKQQMLDKTWQKNDAKFNLGKDITVINYDMFWRHPEDWKQYDTVILDEGHRALGVLPETRQRNKIQIPKTSKTFESILMYLRQFPPKRFYICTATPMGKPMNVWALAKLFGKDWDFFKFRETFYFPTMMGHRQVWLPRKDEATRDRLATAVKKLGYTGALADFMDVPEQTHLTVNIELTDEQDEALRELAQEEANPLVRRSQMRPIENGIRYTKRIESIDEKFDMMLKDTKYFKNGKIDYILDRAEEFKKMFIFTAYRAQTDAIANALTYEGYTVKTVNGDTDDRATVFDEMEALEFGIVVVQAQICEGYRVPSVPCMIFASKSNRFVHYDQGKGRILDSQHLKKNLYIHLVVPDGADEACHEAIMAGVDFQEKLSIL
jgi:superfamily II DNA or RNA helicase